MAARRTLLPLCFLVLPLVVPAQDEPVVFHSDVALVRVDAQVVDRQNRTITGLQADDFVLRENGKPQQVRNFASEDMPIDILLLLDVSGSMRPHVERISNAAHDALRVLGKDDRVAIMVFDTYTRTRLPFRKDRDEISRGLENVLRQESFNGGTHITRALIAAAEYVQREARPEARRAIVILTDDGSQDARDEERVGRALSRADAVLSFLQAPDEFSYRRRGGYPGTGGSSTGTRWPGGGWPGSGPIILGGGGRGSRSPIGGGQVQNHSAGTAEISRDSGGDVFPVDDASALEDTLMRLRQRYALHFNSASAAGDGDRSVIQLDLTDAARRRYRDAEIRYRRVSLSAGSRQAGAISITRAHPPESAPVRVAEAGSGSGEGVSDAPKRRRMSVDQSYGSKVNVTPDERSGDAGPK